MGLHLLAHVLVYFLFPMHWRSQFLVFISLTIASCFVDYHGLFILLERLWLVVLLKESGLYSVFKVHWFCYRSTFYSAQYCFWIDYSNQKDLLELSCFKLIDLGKSFSFSIIYLIHRGIDWLLLVHPLLISGKLSYLLMQKSDCGQVRLLVNCVLHIELNISCLSYPTFLSRSLLIVSVSLVSSSVLNFKKFEDVFQGVSQSIDCTFMDSWMSLVYLDYWSSFWFFFQYSNAVVSLQLYCLIYFWLSCHSQLKMWSLSIAWRQKYPLWILPRLLFSIIYFAVLSQQ